MSISPAPEAANAPTLSIPIPATSIEPPVAGRVRPFGLPAFELADPALSAAPLPPADTPELALGPPYWSSKGLCRAWAEDIVKNATTSAARRANPGL